MERPKTQAEVRKAEFDRHAEVAREIGDAALHDIDAMLAEQDSFMEALHYEGVTDPDEFTQRVIDHDEVFYARSPQHSPNFYQ